MSPIIPPARFAMLVGGSALVIFSLLLLGEYGCSHQASNATRKADVAKGEALEAVHQAIQTDQRSVQNAQALADLQAEKDRLLAELGRLKAQAHQAPRITVSPAPRIGSLPDGGAHVEPVVAGPAEVVAKQDEVIRAQGAYISRLEDQVSTLTSARNQWKTAFEAEERRAVALELALKAQKSAGTYKSAKWGLLGVAVGFVGGRL